MFSQRVQSALQTGDFNLTGRYLAKEKLMKLCVDPEVSSLAQNTRANSEANTDNYKSIFKLSVFHLVRQF